MNAIRTVQASAPPLTARGLSYAYPRAKNCVFSDLDLEAHAGSMLAILGNNGAGKSTLLDLAAGISSPTSGNVSVAGRDISSLTRRQVARNIAYVAQRQTIPHLRVYDEVLMGRKPHISWTISERDRQVVARSIAELQLEDYSERYCDELSGGERQKVFIARALAQEPQILVLDEPTSALDPKNQIEVMDAIREITLEGNLATVLVLHDINLALRFCDRFLLIRDGKTIAFGGTDVVTDESISETYGTPFELVEIHGNRLAIPMS